MLPYVAKGSIRAPHVSLGSICKTPYDVQNPEKLEQGNLANFQYLIKLEKYGLKNRYRLKTLDIFMDNPAVRVFMGSVSALRHMPNAVRLP